MKSTGGERYIAKIKYVSRKVQIFHLFINIFYFISYVFVEIFVQDNVDMCTIYVVFHIYVVCCHIKATLRKALYYIIYLARMHSLLILSSLECLPTTKYVLSNIFTRLAVNSHHYCLHSVSNVCASPATFQYFAHWRCSRYLTK